MPFIGYRKAASSFISLESARILYDLKHLIEYIINNQLLFDFNELFIDKWIYI